MATSEPPVSVTEFLLQGMMSCPNAVGELTLLLTGIVQVIKGISNAYRGTGNADLISMGGNEKASGDDESQLVVQANNAFINKIRSTGSACLMVSKKNSKPIEIEISNRGKYVVCFDPLNGPTDDSEASLGTIFSIFRRRAEKKDQVSASDALQNGANLVVGGYALYGRSATKLVLAIEKSGVHVFEMKPGGVDFILSHKGIKMKTRGKSYTLNESNPFEHVRKYIEGLKSSERKRGAYSACYCRGSMVEEIHNTLMRGGICLYPSTVSNPFREKNMLCECIPLAFIIEQAGGKSTTGTRSILQVTPESIGTTSPFYLGSSGDVEELLSYLSASTATKTK